MPEDRLMTTLCAVDLRSRTSSRTTIDGARDAEAGPSPLQRPPPTRVTCIMALSGRRSTPYLRTCFAIMG